MYHEKLKKILLCADRFIEANDTYNLRLLIDENRLIHSKKPKFIELEAKLLLLCDQAKAGWSLMADCATKAVPPPGIQHIPKWDRRSRVPSLLVWWRHAHLGAAVMRLVFIPKLLKITDILGIVCDSRIHAVLVRTFPQVECFDHESINEISSKFDDYKYLVDLISLPGIFHEDNEFAPDLNFLPDEYSLKRLRDIVGHANRIRCGFSWFTTNPNHAKRIRRSIPGDLATAFLSSFSNINFFSLQHGLNEAGINALQDGVNLATPIDPATDVDGLIALISLMDVIITIDNSIVHLAGAMGKPTILLLPFIPEYKWGLKTKKSLFHKSVSIIRQENEGDWLTPLDEAASILLQYEELFKKCSI